ncbi:MAG: BlaI/MecI/CopY family transcriptional regulator [Limisphaerales bacterium]|jgi:predicted transcriptional regulator
MKKFKLPKPTEAELSILRALWDNGPSTVRNVWEQLNPEHQTGYTTILKLMQIMFEKGLLRRDETERSHVYSASLSEEQAQRQAVGHVLERVFGGSAPKLVMQALAGRKATREELAEIRRLLDQMEGGAE